MRRLPQRRFRRCVIDLIIAVRAAVHLCLTRWFIPSVDPAPGAGASGCALVRPPGREQDEGERGSAEEGCFHSLEEPEAACGLVDGVHVAGAVLDDAVPVDDTLEVACGCARAVGDLGGDGVAELVAWSF